jgi:rhodanese-related sulfurtransferase
MEIDTIKNITAKELSEIYKKDNTIDIIDVRKKSEYLSEHVVGAENLPLSDINDYFTSLPKTTFYMHCEGGYRSMIAGSILKGRGIHDFVNVSGGINEIKEAGVLPLSEYVCPTTL